MRLKPKDFAVRIKAVGSEAIPEQCRLVAVGLGLMVFTGTVEKTPEDRGPTRASWGVSMSNDMTTVIDTEGVPIQATISKGNRVIQSQKPFDQVWINNNQAHVGVLENGGFIPADPGPSKDKRSSRKGRTLVRGGYSIQAPRGMVRLSLEQAVNG